MPDTAPISDFNLRTLNTQEYEQHLETTIEFGGNLLAVGRRGSGKTAICLSAIKARKYRPVICNLSVYDRVDLMGYPLLFDRSSKSRFVEYLLPSLFKHLIDGDIPSVLVLDEIDKCDSSLLAPLLELLQFRSINDTQLPNLKACVATANLVAEGGQRPSLPLLDRMEKYLVSADAKRWMDWAPSANIHPSVVAFIHDNPSELQGAIENDELYADQSPRGWEHTSKLMWFGETNKVDKSILINKVSGCVGKKSGDLYRNYYEHYQTLLPIIDRVMKGETVKEFYKLEITKQFVGAMIICNRVAKMIDDFSPELRKDLRIAPNTAPQVLKTVGKFLQTIDREFALMCVRGTIGVQRMLSIKLENVEGFEELLDELQKRLKN